MNELICATQGQWSIGPYCIDGSAIAGVLIFGLVILTLLVILRMIDRRRGLPIACPVCGQIYATRHRLVAHQYRQHEDHAD